MFFKALLFLTLSVAAIEQSTRIEMQELFHRRPNEVLNQIYPHLDRLNFNQRPYPLFLRK